eukprot:ANDGO_02595.mRNA.1 Sm-like protein LSM8
MDDIYSLHEQVVSVITIEGRHYVGLLMGTDVLGSLVLSECEERVYSAAANTRVEHVGTLVVRGDHVGIIGALDRDADAAMDVTHRILAPIPPFIPVHKHQHQQSSLAARHHHHV